MTEASPGELPLAAWLAELSDERLIRLLEVAARPRRSRRRARSRRWPPGRQSRQSVKAATDDLDFLRLAVLDACSCCSPTTAAVPLTKLLADR